MSSMEHVRLTYNMYLPICVSIDIQIATYILFQSQEGCGFQVFAGLSLGTWDIWLLLWLWVVVVVWFSVSPTPWWGKNHWLDFASFKNKTHLGFPQTLDEFWDPEWFVTTYHKKGTLLASRFEALCRSTTCFLKSSYKYWSHNIYMFRI